MIHKIYLLSAFSRLINLSSDFCMCSCPSHWCKVHALGSIVRWSSAIFFFVLETVICVVFCFLQLSIAVKPLVILLLQMHQMH